jgi:ClpP class serine protease
MLETIIAVAQRDNADIKALAKEQGIALENTRRAELRGSVAIIPVAGPLFKRANLMTEISGATSYEILARDLNEAVKNPQVSGIILDVDSPGGMVNGVSEMAAMIRDANSVKPVTAYVGGLGASAGYYLTAAAGRVVMNKSAMVGSIGAVMGVQGGRSDDGSFEIVSTQSPKKRSDPSTDEGRAQVQATIDGLAQVFIDDVAAFRGVTSEKVMADFGQGGELIGQAAVAAGMADGLGTLESVIAEMSGSAGNTTPAAGQYQSNKGANMSNPNAPAQPVMTMAALRADHGDLVDQIEASAREGMVEASAVEDARAEAATAEHGRIMGILNAEAAADKPKLAMALAGQAGMTAEAAATILAAAAPEARTGGANFDALMGADAPNPDIDADPESTGETETDYAAESARLGEQYGI